MQQWVDCMPFFFYIMHAYRRQVTASVVWRLLASKVGFWSPPSSLMTLRSDPATAVCRRLMMPIKLCFRSWICGFGTETTLRNSSVSFSSVAVVLVVLRSACNCARRDDDIGWQSYAHRRILNCRSTAFHHHMSAESTKSDKQSRSNRNKILYKQIMHNTK